MLRIPVHDHLLLNGSQTKPMGTFHEKSTLVSGNGLVSSDNKPLHEKKLIQTYAVILHQGNNGLNVDGALG